MGRRRLADPELPNKLVGGILGVGDSPAATRKLSEPWLPFGQGIVVIGGGLVGIELAKSLRPVCAEVHVIGDCTGVGYLQGAIADGARVGRDV
jgi:hypothetical protein